jgi:copper/silver efflux system protein
MFERMVEWCARHKGLMLVVAFLVATGGVMALRRSPIDAIPDLTDTQVIVWSEWMGRGPQLVEDQITYPLVTSFISAPQVKSVRGFSMFGMSFVYVIFDDHTDPYWARSRVLEYLAKVQGKLPAGVTPTLGPDATGSGWVFQYVLSDKTGKHDLQELRAFQDFTLRYQLAQVPGAAEVASVGGFEKQYQIVLDPVRLAAFDVTVPEVVDAARMSNGDVGGRVIEWSGREYVFRGLGYVKQKADLENAVIKVGATGTPVRIGDIGRVELGPEIRRGMLEWNGEGEAVGGIVVMRSGENALHVIDGVKARLAELKSSMPEGVDVQIAYDRSGLIRDSISTLSEALTEEMIVVLLFIALFLMHFRSALVAIVTLPVAVLASFIATYAAGVTLNIMSLGGIIIAIGDMVDATVVLVENAHRQLERTGGKNREAVIIAAAKELAKPIFSSLLIIAVSFLPVFALEAQEGRLFRPLAYTKTFAMTAAAILSVTVGPALMVLFIRGRIRPEKSNPVNRLAIAAYGPVLRFALRHRAYVLIAAAVLSASTLWPMSRVGSEFIPPLDEGSFLFMPVTLPNISIEEARQILQKQDRIIKSFPEVASVLGKTGRAETPTDPAPLSMFETVITLKPKSRWRTGMTRERLEADLSNALEMPGMQNALTMPIKARVDMLTTGIRTPVGIKIFGRSLEENEQVGQEIERRLHGVRGTRSVFADRETKGVYVDFEPDRLAIARYGLRVMDVMNIVETAIGGVVIDQTVEGRQRFSVNVRYAKDLRTNLPALERVLVPVRAGMPSGAGSAPAPSGAMGMGGGGPASAMASGAAPVAQVPLAQLGKISVRGGPPMIKDENGGLVSYVFVDTSDSDLGGYVNRAKAALTGLHLPTGTRLQWTGQYEFLERIRARMSLLIPITLLLVIGLLYFEFRKLSMTLLVMLSVPFAVVGSFWLLYLLEFNTSIAVWVGMIALIGVAAETASVMVVYLEQAYERWHGEGRLRTTHDLVECALDGAVLRVRPLLMTVGMNLVGLAPVMLSNGTGADVMKRIASPMIGGLISLTTMTLLIIPVAYVTLRSVTLRREHRARAALPEAEVAATAVAP